MRKNEQAKNIQLFLDSVRTSHRTIGWHKIGKGVCQGCILSSCLFNLYAEYIMQNVSLDEAQAGIKIPRSLFQHHSSKASILGCSAFFMVQLIHLYMTTGKKL